MNKIELAKEIASRTSATVTQNQRFINVMNEVICESIAREESVLIQNFGHYLPWEQSERVGRNPRTGKECKISKRISVKFRPGKKLIDKLNGK